MSISASPLPTALARAVEETRSRLEDGTDKASAWVERVQTDSMDSDRCAICQRRDDQLQEHHVAGKNNSGLTIPACLLCHARLSERQNGWDPRWQLKDSPPLLRETFLFRGLSDLCKERARHFGPSYRELGKRLLATYANRARETIP